MLSFGASGLPCISNGSLRLGVINGGEASDGVPDQGSIGVSGTGSAFLLLVLGNDLASFTLLAF